MRELDRLGEVLVEQRKAENEEAWWRTAAQVASLENTVKGMLVRGYKPKSPKSFFDQWIRNEDVNRERLERIRRGKQRHMARLERERAKKGL
jgi:hypothetical protein